MTPWQKIFSHFGMTQAEFSRAMKRDKSKISRDLASSEGLINGADQKKIIGMAKARGLTIPAEDFLPKL